MNYSKRQRCDQVKKENHKKIEGVQKSAALLTVCTKERDKHTNNHITVQSEMIYFALQEDAKLNHLVRVPGALE